MKVLEFAKKLFKTIPKLVKEAEQALEDGKITSEERKELVMKWVDLICAEFGVRLRWYMRVIISFLVDWAAKKLPSKDITIPPIRSV